jgi:hypothetical protein
VIQILKVNHPRIISDLNFGLRGLLVVILGSKYFPMSSTKTLKRVGLKGYPLYIWVASLPFHYHISSLVADEAHMY